MYIRTKRALAVGVSGKLFESVVDNLLNKYNLADTYNINTRIKTIFDEAS